MRRSSLRRKVTAGKALVRVGQTVELRQKSEPFWKILGRHAIASTILRVPVTFPPEQFNGRCFRRCARRTCGGRRARFSLFTMRRGAGTRWKAATGTLRATDGLGRIRAGGRRTFPFRVRRRCGWKSKARRMRWRRASTRHGSGSVSVGAWDRAVSADRDGALSLVYDAG